MTLDDRQVELYSRQIILRELGGRGQRRLLASGCLLVGTGALSWVASYLAGAGVGRIDIAASDGTEEAGRSALPPLDDRSPDVLIGRVELGSTIDLGAYDVTLAVFGRERAGARATNLHGSSRLGSISLRTDAQGSTELVLLPAGSSGCPWCVRAVAASTASPSPPDPSTELLGETMMALVALRWIAAIARDEGPRGLVLAPAAAAWREAETHIEPECMRGCRT